MKTVPGNSAATMPNQSHNQDLLCRTQAAWTKVVAHMDGMRCSRGHWKGHLSSSALSTATAISAYSLFLKNNPAIDENPIDVNNVLQTQLDAGLDWLGNNQNADGGWGDTQLNYSNISTTMLVVSAIHLAGQCDLFEPQLKLAQRYIQQNGGVEGIRKRYGKDKTFSVPILTNAALAGLVDWSQVSSLPFEAACVPQRFYRFVQMPVVSYAVPALVAIGQVKHHFDPSRNPLIRMIRNRCIAGSLKVLTRMQPASGGFLEAIPLTSFVVMALCAKGLAGHQVVKNGISFLKNTFRNEGTWPIDSDLATWVTSLAIQALSTCTDNSPSDKPPTDQPDYQCNRELIDWHLNCQNQTVHPFTGAAPGGWPWSDLSGAVPDADDTPGALLAIWHWRRWNSSDRSLCQRIDTAAKNGVQWLLKLQNRDGGWPTFCRGWGKLPFDRSGSDITAHVIRGLKCWQNHLQTTGIEKAIKRGFKYLEKHQRPDGSWLPLWFGNQDNCDDENPVYGTAKVLLAYRDCGILDSPNAVLGLKWLIENRNLDGGWGGGASIAAELGQNSDRHNLNHNGSSIEETSLALETLASCHRIFSEYTEQIHKPTSDANSVGLYDSAQLTNSINDGIAWLLEKIENNCYQKPSPIGFYFAKLWYHEQLYPIIFSAAAIGESMNWLSIPRQTISPV
jgi:squalene-hopene/tetraprenyl-beta-curcumene cyclase